MGHAIGHYLNGSASPAKDYGATYDNCVTNTAQSHEMNQKEYQSAAAWEGWAHFYAAVAFNSTAEPNCRFWYYKTMDWNLDSVTAGDPLKHDCEDAPMTGVPAADYLGGMCSGTLTNRGTEFDWLRFWWDLTTDQAVSLATIGNIWNDANPHAWRADDAGAAPYPSTSLRNAASGNSVLTQWDAEDNVNGVQR